MRLQILFLTIMFIVALRPPTLFFWLDWFIAAIACFIISCVFHHIEREEQSRVSKVTRGIEFELEAIKRHLITDVSKDMGNIEFELEAIKHHLTK